MGVFSKLLPSIETTCGQYFHPYDPSCVNTTLFLTRDALKESFRIYVVAYMLGLALRKKIPSNREVQKTVLGILQSTAFLTTNAYGFSIFVCFLRWLFGSYNCLSVSFLPAALASYVAINLERPSRRSLLALYVTNVASETLFKMAVYRGLVRPVRYGEILIFSLSIAQLLYFFRGDHVSADPIYGFLRFLVGKCEERGYEKNRGADEGSDDDVRELQEDSISGGKMMKYSGKNPLMKGYVNLHNWLQLRLSTFTSHPSCPHPDSCLAYIIKDGGRLYLLGYAFQLSLKLLLQHRRILRNPAVLNKILFSLDTMRLGALFSSFNLIFKAVMCGLRRQVGRDDKRFAYPAGVLAGLSFFFFRDNTIALYFMWKTFNVMYNKAADKGCVPNIPHGTEILYCLSTSVLFHAGVLEPANLRPSYWRFLKAISGNRLEKLDRRHLEVFGFGTLSQLDTVLSRERGHPK